MMPQLPSSTTRYHKSHRHIFWILFSSIAFKWGRPKLSGRSDNLVQSQGIKSVLKNLTSLTISKSLKQLVGHRGSSLLVLPLILPVPPRLADLNLSVSNGIKLVMLKAAKSGARHRIYRQWCQWLRPAHPSMTWRSEMKPWSGASLVIHPSSQQGFQFSDVFSKLSARHLSSTFRQSHFSAAPQSRKGQLRNWSLCQVNRVAQVAKVQSVSSSVSKGFHFIRYYLDSCWLEYSDIFCDIFWPRYSTSSRKLGVSTRSVRRWLCWRFLIRVHRCWQPAAIWSVLAIVVIPKQVTSTCISNIW